MKNDLYPLRIALYAVLVAFIMFFIGEPIWVFKTSVAGAALFEKVNAAAVLFNSFVFGLVKSIPFAFGIWLVWQSRIGYHY